MTRDFSFSRLYQLIVKQWVENARLYIYSTLAVLGSLGFCFLFWISIADFDYRKDTPIIFFLFGLFITGALFASTSYNMLGNKDKGTFWLSFPASHLEKLLCMVFYNLIAFTLVYCCCFYLVEQCAIAYIHTLIAKHPNLYSYTGNSDLNSTIPNFFCFFFAVQALYMLGSVYFKRFSFILTTIFGALFIFCMVYYANKLTHALPGFTNFHGIYADMRVDNSDTFKRYALSPFLNQLLLILFQFIWAPFFWLVTLFRLKEKEI